MKRRQFLAGLGAGTAISTLDWLRFFRRFGVPGTAKELGMAEAAAQATTPEPRFLIYWFQEGGWDGYSMFNPVDTPNDASRTIPAGTLNPNPSWSEHRYRPIGWGDVLALPQTQGNIRYGYLAEEGLELFPDLAVLSSHDGSTFHSGSRWDYHYGKYNRSLANAREPDERTVMQAFCEAYGANYLMPHISWHRWLSDGELSVPTYPVGTGYYEQLGPAYAHTIYGKTPSDLRSRLIAIANLSGTIRDARIRSFTDDLHQSFLRDKNGPSVAAFRSAVEIHKSVVGNDLQFNPAAFFNDAALRTDFQIAPEDEQTTARSVNGNPARSKETPNTNVQAMMTYELMRAGLSCGFWIENREIRGFDSHKIRRDIMRDHGQRNQKTIMGSNLWRPLKTLVEKLKSTQYADTGRSLYDFTTIALTSEMGRSIYGDVQPILDTADADDIKYANIMDQDTCAHWRTNSAAFLGGTVQGDRQWGRVGTGSLDAIPIMPDGTLDPAYDSTTGLLRSGQTKSASSMIPDAGHVYATALYLTGLDPDAMRSGGKGRNNRPPLTFIKK